MEETIRLLPHRKSIRARVAKQPLLSYIVLVFFISWTAWFCQYKSNIELFNGFGMIGAMAPALAAMIIAAILNSNPSDASMRSRWKLFGFLSVGFLSVLFLRRLWLTTDLTTVSGRVATGQVYSSVIVFLLDILAAGVAAFIFSGNLSSYQGVRKLLCSFDLRKLKPVWYWYLIALLLYPIIVLLGNTISAGFGVSGLLPKASGVWYFLVLDVLLTFLVTMFGGGGLEEPGWRGFTLPRLLRRTNPLVASIILAVIWAFWHWPMFWFGYYGGGAFGVFPFIIGCLPISILLTAVFQRSKCSLPIVIILHTSINITPTFLPISPISSGLWWLLLAGIGIWMWRSPLSFSSQRNSFKVVEQPNSTQENDFSIIKKL